MMWLLNLGFAASESEAPPAPDKGKIVTIVAKLGTLRS